MVSFGTECFLGSFGGLDQVVLPPPLVPSPPAPYFICAQLLGPQGLHEQP